MSPIPFSPRREEVEAVADAIKDATSLEEVAKLSLKASFAIIQKRQTWAIATDAHIIYAPYASEADAYSALAGGKVDGFEDEEGIKAIRKEKGIPTLGGKAAVLALSGPLALEDHLEHHDGKARIIAEHLCPTCQHKKAAHGLNGRSTACSIQGCKCKAVPSHPII